MSFYESIDFSKYGINFDCNPDITKLPISISSEIIPVKNQDGKIIFTKPDGSNVSIKLNTKLGSGSFGSVWDIDALIDEGVPLIVKILEIGNINDRNKLAKYEYDIIQEACIQIILYESTKDVTIPEINLNGPFVPKLYLIGKDSNSYYIVSEKLDNDLDKTLQKVAIPTTEFVITSVLHLSKILEVLYDKVKFNHRDLKPDNVMYKMIGDKMHIRLIDFGFSCLKYRELGLSAISEKIYASKLHCNSRIRDMHSYLYFLLNHTIYTSLDCPIKRVFNALIATDNDTEIERWSNTYMRFNNINSEGNRRAALNCSFDIVYRIFLSLNLSGRSSCSEIEPSWTKNLTKIYKFTELLLTDDEYKNIRPEVLQSFLIPYISSNFGLIWRRNSSKDIFMSELTYIRNVRRCGPSSNSPCVTVFSVPSEILPVLFDEFIKSPFVMEDDKIGETILHKIARNEAIATSKPDNNYLDRVLELFSLRKKELINKKSDAGETAYDIATSTNYNDAKLKLEKYLIGKVGGRRKKTHKNRRLKRKTLKRR